MDHESLRGIGLEALSDRKTFLEQMGKSEILQMTKPQLMIDPNGMTLTFFLFFIFFFWYDSFNFRASSYVLTNLSV